MPNPHPLLVCSASARWLVQSAIQAGFQPHAMDLFADWDTQELCPVRQVKSLNAAVPWFADHPDHRWLMAGGLESNINEFAELSKLPNWLNTSLESLIRSRQPFEWTSELQRQGIDVAEIKTSSGQHDSSQQWIRKRSDSSGGLGVGFASSPAPFPDSQTYLQRFVHGQPTSSLHVRGRQQFETLGVFIQLIGNPYSQPNPNAKFDKRKYEWPTDSPVFAPEEWNASPFHFSGAIGPFACPTWHNHLHEVARSLGEFCDLTGVFGIDWIDSGETVIPIEINPRITATAELWERSSSGNIIQLHADALQSKPLSIPECQTMEAKAIQWNLNSMQVVNHEIHAELIREHQAGRLADIPTPGSQILPGAPMYTALAAACDLTETMAFQKVFQSLTGIVNRTRAIWLV